MKTNDLDLGQKVKFLHFLIWNDNSTGGKFFLYMKSGLKVKRRRKKRVKSREKKLQKIFCLAASTQGEEMTLIKVAYFMLNFLNLKSKPIHLFFGVASSLSMVWAMSAHSSLQENKVLLTKAFQASPTWHQLKELVFINWKNTISKINGF